MSDETENTVGDMMQKQNVDILKMLTYTVGAAVYVAGVVYAETHGFSMLSKGVSPEFMVWAIAGMIAVGITALVLPIMLVKVIKDPLQWVICLLFYVVDVGIMGVNAAVDFMTNTAGELPAWGALYASWILPLTPVVVAGGWVIDFLLDPDVRKRLKLARVDSAIQDTRLNMAVKHASTAQAGAMIDAQAAVDAQALLMAGLGQPVYRGLARDLGGVVIGAQARDVPSQAAILTDTAPRPTWWRKMRKPSEASKPSDASEPNAKSEPSQPPAADPALVAAMVQALTAAMQPTQPAGIYSADTSANVASDRPNANGGEL